MGLTLLCGIPSETPLAMVHERLDSLGAPYVWFNQRAWDRMDLHFQVASGHVTGLLQVEGRSYRLEDFSGVYLRLMDDQLLPDLQREPPGSARSLRCRALHAALASWSEITPARVLNRLTAMASNGSKPYQSQLIRAQGLAVPETLITNDPERVRDFRRRHGKVIYKSLSGVRSIVQLLDDGDDARLDAIRWCATQFQAFVEGTNVRVHVIAGEVFATAALTEATDYRYAYRQGSSARLEPFDLPDELADRCVRLAHALRLEFAGIDLKLTPDGRAFCFEVNPSPAFSFYEGHTGQPIAAAVARSLDQGAGTARERLR
jgi:RimK-like ATP-grasp domain